MINDSDVLVNYKASEIKRLAKDAGITIEIENKKVVIPNDKEQIKSIKRLILQWLKPTGILENQSLRNRVAMKRRSMVQAC